MKNISTAKKIFLSLMLLFSFLFVGSFATISWNLAQAHTSYYGTNTVSVTNGNFTSYSSNSNKLPFDISSGWNAIAGLQNETYSGIIDTESSAFSKNDSFTLPANPKTYSSSSSVDSKILMIKSKNNSTGTKFGYESAGITLSENKFYQIVVRVKTGLLDEEEDLIEDTSAFASIYTNLTNNAEYPSISTSGTWIAYNIFIATDIFNSSTLNLQLRLGNKNAKSTGVVFFDNVEIFEISELDYFTEENSPSPVKQFVNLNRTEVSSFTNSNFENDLDGFDVVEGSGNVSTPILSSISSSIEQSNGADSFIDENTKSLFINNKTKSKTTVSSSNANVVTIKQHGYYYLSVLIKTGSLSSGGLTITLDEKVNTGEPITISQSDLTSSSGSNQYNGFSLVSFYIKGNAKKDSNIGISFSLGSSDATISGWAIVDNIKMYQISQNEYSTKSSSSKSLDLSKNIEEISSIKNGSFDFISSSNASIAYPLMPESWSYSASNSLSGIIRVNANKFATDCTNYGLTSSQNPGPNTAYYAYAESGYTPTSATTDQNVLMIRTSKNQESFFTSSSISLSKNSETDSKTIDKIEIGIKTLNSAKAFVKLVDSNNNDLALIENISAEEWTTYSIYIKNGISEASVKLIVGVNGNENNNYAFFDFAKYSSNVSLSTAEILDLNNSCYVDLITDSFYSHKSTKNNYNVYDLVNWSDCMVDATSLSALYNGVVYAPSVDDLEIRENALDNNILVVTNVNNSYQIIKSNYNYSLASGKYYEFSVYIKTDLNANLNFGDYGAYFEITTVDKTTNQLNVSNSNTNKFVNIISSSDDNNWEKYSIYVYAENDESVCVLLGLGSLDNPTLGKVYFDDLTVQAISKDDYKEKTSSNNTIVSKVLDSSSSSSNSSSQSNSSVKTESNPINIFILFSSIILAIALVLAIAGYLIRRIPKRTMAKVEKSEYNIKPTKVNELEIKQNLKNSRESKLKELKVKLEELKVERDALKAEYEEKSSKEENLTAKENIYKSYTKKINKLTKQIDYIESAITFNEDAINIKQMENMEIKKKQKESIQEFIKLKNESDLEKEVEVEEKPKKTKGKKFNPNRIKKDKK